MDPIEDGMPPKLKLDKIDREFSEAKEYIQKVDHLHLSKIKEWIKSTLSS